MWELVPVLTISCVLACFSHVFSSYNIAIGKYERKENFIFVIITVVMTVFVCMRTKYNDTTTYLETYIYLTPDDIGFFQNVKMTNWLKIGDNPGFAFLYRFLKHAGFSTQQFLSFFAVLTVPVYMWFIRKYTDNIFFSVFLMFVVGPYVFALAAIKQTWAMALLAIATDREINRKHGKFVFWVLLACTIHAYSWLYFIIPFLKFKPWTKKTYWSLFFFGLFGIALSVALSGVLNITSILGDEYTAEDMSGAGVNIFRFGVTAMPLFLSFVFRKKIEVDEYDEKDNMMINVSILHGELMFIALFGTANYFARLANYFQIFAMISMPKLVKYFDKKYRNIIYVVAIILYLIFFYYDNTISGYNTFDKSFDRLTVQEFFKTIFVFDNAGG